MDQRRDGRRTLHGVGQPGMQQKLGRLAHGAHEQQETDQRQGIDVGAQELHGLADLIRRRGEDRVVLDGVEQGEGGEDAEREAEIADAVDDEGLDRRGIGCGAVIPEADEQVAHQPHAFPAEEELHEVVGGHERQHREGEEREIGEEARAVRVLLHVADGIEMHEAGHEGDHHEHHRGQRVDPERPGGMQIARVNEAQKLDTLLMALDGDLIEGEARQERRHEHEARGHHLRSARAHEPAEKACKDRAEQRQENDRLIHAWLLSPSAGRFRRHRWCRGCGNRRRRGRALWRLRPRRRSAR